MDAILAHSQQPIPPTATDQVAEAHHRVANSLALLIGMMRIQAMSVKKKGDSYSNAEVRHLLDGVAARISTISQLHRILSQSGSDGVINLKPHLRSIADVLVAAFPAPSRKCALCMPEATA